jgi:hypothetical protein
MRRWLVLSGLIWACALALAGAQAPPSPDGLRRARGPAFPGTIDQHPAIDYGFAPVTDRLTRVDTSGLVFEGPQGYLRSLLAALGIPVESQVLLFSKTGVQHPFTNPANPRALYFDDQVVVGYIPGAPILEIASHDPQQGVIFYTLKQDAALAPNLLRPGRVCLSCHLSANSLEVPGLLVRSMFTGPEGRTMPQLGSFLIDHRTPLERRWGGWYVTGTHGAARHMGNAMVADPAEPDAAIHEATLNRATLDSRVDLALYPTATSDIAALMVFDHQGRAINLLTRLGWETRIAKAEARLDFSTGDLRDLAHQAADYLVFADEAPLTAPVRGTSSFARVFAAAGPRDSKGRSLRDLDLTTALLRHRCSYMVYSPAFAALPAEARAAVIARMKDVLARRDGAASEILSETLAGWR